MFYLGRTARGCIALRGGLGLFFAFLCADTAFQVTSPSSAPASVTVLCPLMDHKQGVLRAPLTKGRRQGEGGNDKQSALVQLEQVISSDGDMP